MITWVKDKNNSRKQFGMQGAIKVFTLTIVGNQHQLICNLPQAAQVPAQPNETLAKDCAVVIISKWMVAAGFHI